MKSVSDNNHFQLYYFPIASYIQSISHVIFNTHWQYLWRRHYKYLSYKESKAKRGKVIWGHSAGKWQRLDLNSLAVTRAHALTHYILLPLFKAVWGNTCYAMKLFEVHTISPSFFPFQLPGRQARAPAEALFCLPVAPPTLPAPLLHASPPSSPINSRRLPSHCQSIFWPPANSFLTPIGNKTTAGPQIMSYHAMPFHYNVNEML